MPRSTLLLALTASTGLLLAPLAYLLAATGFCSLNPQAASIALLGAGDVALCMRLHTGSLAPATVALAVVHTLAALELLEPATRNQPKWLKTLYNTYRATAWILAGLLLALALQHIAH